MTATVVSADGTNTIDVKTAVETLTVTANDKLLSYRIGTRVYFVKYEV